MTIRLDQLRARWASGRGNWLSRLGAVAVLALAVIVGVALSAFLFGFFLVLAAAASIWLWWQQWRLKRKARRGAGSGTGSSETRVIQGEYEVTHEEEVHRQPSDRRRAGDRSDNDPRAPRS
jgi:uncharacterized protein (DUF58 family)